MKIIYDRMLSGELRTGQKLPGELELSNQMGIARTTVREALGQLLGLGLIVRGENGMYVSEEPISVVRSRPAPILLKNWEIRKLYEAMMIIEGELAVLAAARATEKDIDALKEINGQMFSERGSGSGYWEKDTAFHDRVAKISENIPLESDIADVIDAGKRVVIPGLINLHTHITRRHLHRVPLSVPFRQGAPEIENSPITTRILYALRNALLELGDGVTTIRDAGSKSGISIDLRNAISSGICFGPRILASGEAVAMTGGHESHRYHAAREADGPDEVRKAVREQLKAGVDCIEQGVLMSDSTLRMMKEMGRSFVPSVSGIYKV